MSPNSFDYLGVELRQAVAADVDFVWRLHRLTLIEHDKHPASDAAEQRARFYAAYTPANTFLAYKGSALIGWIKIVDSGKAVTLEHLELLPDHRRQGYGAYLVGTILATADRRRIPAHLKLVKGSPALAFCRRLGFEVVTTTGAHHHLIYLPR